jgi:hypothetical protein
MDRQDIDALLISALYGELTPADEARLQAHLEAHPGDRGALDDLKVARQKLHDSRIFEIQLEPPQAVSALLLQEAHRRAPKRVVATDGGERESWFARFAKSFMSHPAMAAAAMLVLVLGGAGIVYMKKGDQFAAKEMSAPAVSSEQVERNAPAPTATATPQGAYDYDTNVAAGSGYNAQLYEGASGSPAADKGATEDTHGELERQRAAVAQAQHEAAQRKQALDAVKSERDLSIEVAPTERAPKDLDDRKLAKKADTADDEYSSRPGTATGTKAKGGAGASAGPSAAYGDGNANAVSGADIATGSVMGGESPRAQGAGGGGYAQPPPPPAPAKVATNKAPATPTAAPTAPAATTTPSPKTATVAKKSPAPAPAMEEPDAIATKEKAEPKPDSSLLAWAKAEHARAVALAQKGDCSGAAKVALTVSTRAGSYYSQNMATDRALKQCTQYIAAERERAAAKARAEKAAAPTSTTK